MLLCSCLFPLALQASSLQYEMLLLTDSISKEDSCWELRLRCGEFGAQLVRSFSEGGRLPGAVLATGWEAGALCLHTLLGEA